MKRIIAILLFLLAAGVVIFLILYPKFKETKLRPQVKDFEDCVKAGYPVMESYPRQCSLPSGRFFVENFIPQN